LLATAKLGAELATTIAPVARSVTLTPRQAFTGCPTSNRIDLVIIAPEAVTDATSEATSEAVEMSSTAQIV